jgi:hypothetical protein
LLLKLHPYLGSKMLCLMPQRILPVRESRMPSSNPKSPRGRRNRSTPGSLRAARLFNKNTGRFVWTK